MGTEKYRAVIVEYPSDLYDSKIIDRGFFGEWKQFVVEASDREDAYKKLIGVSKKVKCSKNDLIPLVTDISVWQSLSPGDTFIK